MGCAGKPEGFVFNLLICSNGNVLWNLTGGKNLLTEARPPRSPGFLASPHGVVVTAGPGGGGMKTLSQLPGSLRESREYRHSATGPHAPKPRLSQVQFLFQIWGMKYFDDSDVKFFGLLFFWGDFRNSPLHLEGE